MAKKTGSAAPKSSYRKKVESGLVYRYDRDSRSFQEGAWKNWPHNRDKNKNIVWMQPEADRAFKADLQALAARQTRYHQFVG